MALKPKFQSHYFLFFVVININFFCSLNKEDLDNFWELIKYGHQELNKLNKDD